MQAFARNADIKNISLLESRSSHAAYAAAPPTGRRSRGQFRPARRGDIGKDAIFAV